jgi:hypothetical protein
LAGHILHHFQFCLICAQLLLTQSVKLIRREVQPLIYGNPKLSRMVKLGKIGQHDQITTHFVHTEIMKIYVFFIHSREKEGWAQGLKSTGKLMVVLGPQYLRAAKSYALAALSSLSYPPAGQAKQIYKLHKSIRLN